MSHGEYLMALQSWKQSLLTSFKPLAEIDRDMVDAIRGQSLQVRGSIRLIMSRVSTTAAIERRRKELSQ
jgi:hypothetical protein